MVDKYLHEVASVISVVFRRLTHVETIQVDEETGGWVPRWMWDRAWDARVHKVLRGKLGRGVIVTSVYMDQR